MNASPPPPSKTTGELYRRLAMRIVMTAALIAALSGTAYAADDSLDKAVKKTGDGFGNLLNAMGQEIKKSGIGDEGKKDEKKDEAKDEKKPAAKADPNPKESRSNP
jgi:hypothetical protein